MHMTEINSKLKNSLSNTSPNKFGKLSKYFPWILIICGIIGLLASSILTIEKIHLAKDATYKTSCSINPVFSCNNVITSPEASAFGFPNPIIGIVGFSLAIGLGFTLLTGAKIENKYYWWAVQFWPTFGILFCIWLMSKTLYDIGALCLYCMVTWLVTAIIFTITTAYNHSINNIFPSRLNRLFGFLSSHQLDFIGLYILIVVILIVSRFWDYFSTLI
jgi:uncharacterized membrane protein